LDLLDSSGLMRAILPELEAMKGVLQPEQFIPRATYRSTADVAAASETVSVPLSFRRVVSRCRETGHATVDQQAEFVSTTTTASAPDDGGDHAAPAIFRR